MLNKSDSAVGREPRLVTTLALPFPPSVNHAFENNAKGGRNRGRRNSVSYNLWKNECFYKIKALGLKGKYRFYMFYYFKDRHRRDISNYLKCIEDFLVQRGFIVDDNQDYITSHLTQNMGIDIANPRIELIVVENPIRADIMLKIELGIQE